MADQPWAIALAIETQSEFGTIGENVPGLSGSIDSTNGIVLGDKNSGDAESGITIPNFERIVREVAAVSESFTEQADAFLRTAVNGLAISLPTQGNGADAGTPASPTQDAASLSTLLPGRDAIYQCAGHTETTGASDPDVDYDPRATAVYATIKLWIGGSTTGMSYVFKDCICESLAWVLTPGQNCIETANFKVGSLDAAEADVTFPTLDYTTQASLAAPVVEGVTFAIFGQVRGFENLTITCTNTIEEFQDSSVTTTGLRQAQTRRQYIVDGQLYVVLAEPEAAYTEHVNTSPPTDDLSCQIGTADTDGETTELNAFQFNVNNLEAKNIKYNKIGTATSVELSGCKATGTTAASEFKLKFN